MQVMEWKSQISIQFYLQFLNDLQNDHDDEENKLPSAVYEEP